MDYIITIGIKEKMSELKNNYETLLKQVNSLTNVDDKWKFF